MNTAGSNKHMRVVTVNLPEQYLKAVDSLLQDPGLFSNRCELIRVAIREFIIREMEVAKQVTDPGPIPEKKSLPRVIDNTQRIDKQDLPPEVQKLLIERRILR